MNIVAVPPQSSPVVLHARCGASSGSAGASIGASISASDRSITLASIAGASRSEQLPSTQRCGVGHCSEVWHDAPSGGDGL
jgi:hypothetical protein